MGRNEDGTIFGDATPPDWTRADDIGEGLQLLTYVDGSVRFRHRCDRGSRGVIICAPHLQVGKPNGHVLTRDEAGVPTVTPSILCLDCNTHGFVTGGVWRSV